MNKMLLNNELKGIELYFDAKPIQSIIDGLKSNGFRWHNFKKCWYAKQSEQTIEIANKYINNVDSNTSITAPEQTITAPTTKAKAEKTNIKPLYERVNFIQGTADTSKYRYRFVGSNYTGLSVKETAAEIRKHLKAQFPEVKFSITSDYHKIYVEIKSSPYNNLKLAYSSDIEPKEYRQYEEDNNKELAAIKKYCQDLLDSYNYDDSDTMSDYFNCHYYDSVSVDYEYIQTEQTEATKADITAFRQQLELDAKAEGERKEAEWQERLKQQEIDHQNYLIRAEEKKKEIELINNSVNVIDLDETKQYFIIGSEFAHMNKNNTLNEYIEEVKNGEYELNNVKVTREIHFKSAEALNLFSNHLLTDFTFLEQTGGSYTDDYRINSMTDYNNMNEEERETVIFNSLGVAVYYNNQLQYVIDAQGYSYARYVGLTDNATITKHDTVKQLINKEELQQLKEKADIITDISFETITELDITKTWNSDNWTEYKEAFKNKLKTSNIKLTKSIIQQLPEELETLKVAMYKLLIEVDGIQEQFKNADIQQGQKLTMFYISDFGSIVTNRITFESVENTKYAQYDNNVKITYTPQGKRTKYYNHFHSTLLVYNGWLELPETVLHEVETRNGITITRTKYGSCDKKQYDDILEYFDAQGIKPIVNTYKPTF
jgi:hypothetical protein